jgi:hypothetical protein
MSSDGNLMGSSVMVGSSWGESVKAPYFMGAKGNYPY